MQGGDYEAPDRDDLVASIGLSDGGVYDNMGLEPVWKDHAAVLVSDGGAVFEPEGDRGLFWRLNRYTAVAGHQDCPAQALADLQLRSRCHVRGILGAWIARCPL